MKANLKLTSLEFDKLVDDTSDPLMDDTGEYQRIVGRLLYFTITKPDIDFTVQCLSQFIYFPKISHMHTVVKVLKYLKNAPGLGVFMLASTNSQLIAYCDADWATCTDTWRSVTGYILKLVDSLLSWKSKK